MALTVETPGSVADAAWAASGAMALTGHGDGPPLLAPRGLMRHVVDWQQRLVAVTDGRVDVDAGALLGERAALAGLTRQGRVSCGGSTRLLRTSDGWLALSTARPADVEMLPAWLGTEATVDVADLAVMVRSRRTVELVERGTLLGMPCSRLGEVVHHGDPALIEHLAAGPARSGVTDALVVDLSALWAGPLCSQLLGIAGARVVSVTSSRRLDAARRSDPDFFDLLHAGHESLELDFTSRADIALLAALLRRADIVVEASRPRALAQLGLDARAIATAHGSQVWLSITAHGRAGDAAMRVGFGDDAAVAGGLVAVAAGAGPAGDPVFCGDAIADPLTGLAGAVTVLERFRRGGSWLVDLAMARVAAVCASDTPTSQAWCGDVSAPRARPPRGNAVKIGVDTERWRLELGCR